ncbi:MAG: YceI family protein [Desulfohalobiaceae bacterium]
MKCLSSSLTVICLVLFSAGLTQARELTWQIDPPHSHFYFDARHTFVTVRGQFNGFTGDIAFDPDNPAGGRLNFEVEVSSIDTGVTRRDDHLRSDDFFAAGKYPKMRFTTTALRQVEGGGYEIEGDLTIKDVTRTVTLPLTWFGVQENPLKKNQLVAGIEVAFSLDRMEYGVGTGKFLEMGVLGKDVQVLVALEVVRDK